MMKVGSEFCVGIAMCASAVRREMPSELFTSHSHCSNLSWCSGSVGETVINYQDENCQKTDIHPFMKNFLWNVKLSLRGLKKIQSDFLRHFFFLNGLENVFKMN